MGVVKRSVAIHPALDEFVRKTWAMLIEAGYDASYSTALNFMLLTAVMMVKEYGMGKETIETLRDFLRDKETIKELNLTDIIEKLKGYTADLQQKRQESHIYM